RRRPSGCVRVETGKRERAGRVAQLVGAVPAGVELNAGADRVASDCDVEILVQLDDVRAARAAHLSAAGIERVEHEDCRRRADWRERGLVRADLQTQVVVEGLADRSAERRANDILGPYLRVTALGKIEVADA